MTVVIKPGLEETGQKEGAREGTVWAGQQKVVNPREGWGQRERGDCRQLIGRQHGDALGEQWH